MELTEAKIYEAFGLEAPEESGAGEQVQDTADPASQAVTAPEEGAQGQEVAEPAEGAEGGEKPIDGEDPEENGDPPAEPEKQPLTQEQRRANAARRRQQEQQAAIDAAVQAEKDKQAQELEAFFQRMGMKDSFTNEPIKTMDQFNAWKEKFDAEQLSKDLKEGKATAEQLQQMVANHPVIRQAQQLIEQNQQLQAQQQNSAIQARVDADIAEIHKLNPEINSLDDILASPKAEIFREHAKTMDFLNAYRLTYFDELTARKADAARQQAINNTRGKDHLQAVGGTRGAGAVTVPAREMAMYRAFNPNATPEQIQAHYNKYKKS